ncbi:MAG: glycosyltransferase family 1 protein [Phycisphaerales bacterium]|nr:glycosyltransferase family 1 protein [Phycisphaerales bacterium]
MRVLLTSIGSSGDINPFIAIGAALRDRGHEVVLMVNPYFEATVRGAGLAFEPLGGMLSPTQIARDFPGAFKRRTGAHVLIRRVIVPMVGELTRLVRVAIRKHRPDLVLCHQISFGVPWACRDRGVPFATCVLAPVTLLSTADPAVYPSGIDPARWPRGVVRAHHALAHRVLDVILDGPLNVARREFGLPPERGTFRGEMLSGRAVLGMWSGVFRGPAADDPSNLAICGFPWFDRHAHHGEQSERLDPGLERFLDGGEEPIVFTLGSVLSHTGHGVYAAAVEACRRLGRRGVLVTGTRESAPASLPEGVHQVNYAPYGLLLPRACCVVHHGGVGTTAQALRAGRPTVILPAAHDQFDNASRCGKLGVSMVGPERPSGRRLAGLLDAVLGDADVSRRAAEVGRAVGGEDGAVRAAEVLEGLAG